MNERDIRRILIALDASPPSLAALEVAAELAARTRAELDALFVEDIELFRVASVLAEVEEEVAVEEAPHPARDLERRLRTQAGRVRERLERLARRLGFAFTFRVVRGEVTGEILRAAAGADLVVLGRVGWAAGGGRRLGRTASAVLERTGGGLFLPFHAHPESVLLVVVRERAAAGP